MLLTFTALTLLVERQEGHLACKIPQTGNRKRFLFGRPARPGVSTENSWLNENEISNSSCCSSTVVAAAATAVALVELL